MSDNAGTLRIARTCGGFTLVEVVVALSVLSLLMVVLYDGLRLGMRTWDAGTRRVDRSDRLRRLEDFMRGQLGRVHLPAGAAQAVDKSRRFQGEATRMRFIGRLPRHAGQGALYEFDIGVEGDTSMGKRLVVRYVMGGEYASAGAVPVPARHEVLVEGIGGAWFEYFGLDERGQWDWTERWDRPQVLPALVRLRIEPGEGVARPWPVMVFRVREGDFWAPRVSS